MRLALEELLDFKPWLGLTLYEVDGLTLVDAICFSLEAASKLEDGEVDCQT